MHFHDAAAALWLEGELVHLEDLVLHDAHMDIRAPTHELTRAHAVLRARRQILGAKAGWALSREGLLQLTRHTPTTTGTTGVAAPEIKSKAIGTAISAGVDADQPDDREIEDARDAEPAGLDFADIDAVLERTSRLLDGETSVRTPRPTPPVDARRRWSTISTGTRKSACRSGRPC